MTNIKNIVTVNPRIKPVYGWESPKSIQVVASIIEGILEGDDIPLFPIFDCTDYWVLPYNIDRNSVPGGHNRTLAYFYLLQSFNAELVQQDLMLNMPLERIKIDSIVIEDDPNDLVERRMMGYYRDPTNESMQKIVSMQNSSH